jgi:hypothetical protein
MLMQDFEMNSPVVTITIVPAFKPSSKAEQELFEKEMFYPLYLLILPARDFA